MAIETLYDLWLAKGRIHVRCAWGGREGMKSVRECGFRYEPDLMSLMITRGRSGQLADLRTKMRCPMFGSWLLSIGITLPGQSDISALRDALG